jgi:glyoxylase-like metal-dependent hydrolase (beta-lactamase superfamily II)
MEIGVFTFNDFSENTYVLSDDSGQCIIIDPGCNTLEEQKQLTSYIEAKKLTPVRLINTHCHIDHVLGNRYISETYKLDLEAHEGEISILESCVMVASMYHIPYNPSPMIAKKLLEGEKIAFGKTTLDIIFTPGHSPASISLYNSDNNVLVAGDVLFKRSIGRTDLPGGNFETLKASIQKKLYLLPDETVVFPGHGPSTTIGEEKAENQFVRENS